ncbi:MAG TPA: endonuclease III [Candidatus Hydrogenedentes bacterium]|nr:endonuclease III [Candidatus Hydrogenedentota bacterium]
MSTKIRQKLGAIDRLLEEQYGRPRRKRGAPLDTLMETVLSQNTSDVNSGRAYDAMRKVFPTWEEVMQAPRDALEAVLKPGGLAHTKAARIQTILRALADRGPVSLDWIEDLSDEAAEEALLAFDGVGFKTARCVLLFALGRDVFPIDTHILRVLKRTGIVAANVTADQAHKALPQHIAKGRCYVLHLNLIAHGRRVCRRRNPACAACVIRRCCRYARSGRAA